MDTCLKEDEAWQMQTTCHKVESGATLRVPAVLKFLAILLSSAFIYVILWGANPLTPKFETAMSQILSVSPKPSTSTFIQIPSTWSPSNLTRSAIIENKACGDYIPGTDGVIVIRAAKTLSQVKQAVILHYSESLGDAFDLWLVVDHTNLDADARTVLEIQLRTLQAQAPHPVHVFMYDLELEKRMFPTAARRFDRVGPILNHGMHATSIVLWWRLCGGYPNLEPPATLVDIHGARGMRAPEGLPYVWIVEMDAGFSGDPRTFFDYYKGKKYDLVVNSVRPAAQPWLHYKRLEAGDTWELDAEFYRVKNDFVERMSPRFLYHLDVLLRASVISYGEAYEATVCTSVLHDWCTLHAFADDGFAGHILTYDGAVDADQWRMYNEKPAYQNKWYHAVLPYKEHRRQLGHLEGRHNRSRQQSE